MLWLWEGTYDILCGILWPSHVVSKQQLSDQKAPQAEDDRHEASDLGWCARIFPSPDAVCEVTGNVVDARDG